MPVAEAFSTLCAPPQSESTNPLKFQAFFSTSANGPLVFQDQRRSVHIWSLALGGPLLGRSLARVTDTADFDAFPNVSHDQQWLAFTRTSSETGVRQVWLRNLQSGKETLMTDTPGTKSNPL